MAKIVYRIFCGTNDHTPQFDEQLRLIFAEDELHAFHKARLLGEREDDCRPDGIQKPSRWKFIDVTAVFLVEDETDGAEVYSHISEEEDAEIYIRNIRQTALKLYENCLKRNIFMN